MIKSTYNRGFILEFDNGFSISVQFGTVVEPKSMTTKWNDMERPIVESQVAVVSIFDPRGKVLVIDERTLIQMQSADMVADWICKVRNARNQGDIIGHIEEAWE